MLLPIHIAAGGLALVLGAVALFVKKGGTIHRRSGLLFVYAMLVMGISASILALKGRVGGIDGRSDGYFVATALTTVRPRRRGRAGSTSLRSRSRSDSRSSRLWAGSRTSIARLLTQTASRIGRSASCLSSSPPCCCWRRPATCASCVSACLAAGHAWRGIYGACASPCSSPPARSSRSKSAWRKSFPSHSRLGRCARCRSCCCLARCSIGCGGSAAAARCQCSSDTIRCHSPPAPSELHSHVSPAVLPRWWRHRSIFIGIIASKARLASPPPAASASVSARGVICQESPGGLHQPHALSLPPLPTIAFQYRAWWLFQLASYRLPII